MNSLTFLAFDMQVVDVAAEGAPTWHVRAPVPRHTCGVRKAMGICCHRIAGTKGSARLALKETLGPENT
ncbi:MAG: hypothetical protein QM740_20460 [Acidovorax sp.]